MKRTAQAKMDQFSQLGGKLHFRSDLHLARKFWHMGMGLLIVLLYLAGVPQGRALVILACFLGADVFMEMLRLHSPAVNEKMVKFWGPILRQEEFARMSTVPQYIASVIVAIAIFPKPVAVLGILYLACGDPIASLFGILYGHLGHRFKNGKSVIGCAAGVMACALVSWIYLSTLSISTGSVLMLSVIGGLAGGLAELIPFDVDDNFSIPIISGFALWLGFLVLGL